jgi:dUTP pyrophosphatase
MEVRITKLDPAATLPGQAHQHDAGYDLCANEDAHLPAGGGRGLVPTGIALAIPPPSRPGTRGWCSRARDSH